MTDDCRNRMPQTPSAPDDEQSPCRPSNNILDALDMEGVGDIEIAFKRPVSQPRPATFD